MTPLPASYFNLGAQRVRLTRVLASWNADDRARVEAALAFAEQSHAGQYRKGEAHEPYIIHPVRVACALCDELDIRDADVVVAALLHDVVEDCGVALAEVERRFGGRVRAFVDGMTQRTGESKWAHAERASTGSALLRVVKFADTLDNGRGLWDVAERADVLRRMYGYGMWGMVVAARVGPQAVELLRGALAESIARTFGSDPEPPFVPNPGKSLVTGSAQRPMPGARFARYPIRTHVVTASDHLIEIVRRYAVPYLRPGDLLAISERIVAITQGRAFPIADIHPSRWARFLVRFVHRSPYGIGLGSPWTMELAIREAGLPRILLAAVAAALSKPFGVRGVFYRVVGQHINAIDGPCEYTIPLADGARYAKLGPRDPNGMAERLARAIGVDTAIVDANDLGVNVLGVSEGVDHAFVADVFRDNPLGQSMEQTPMAIVRRRDVDTERSRGRV